MKQRKKSKIIAILALCVSVLGLTLGFAAFSNTLTISSSATVTPDASDFKLMAYGLEDVSGDILSIAFEPSSYTSSTFSKPYLRNAAVAENAKIESSNVNGSNSVVISNLNPVLKNPGDSATYYFMVKNEGQYDAYLANQNLKVSSPSKVCEPVVKEGQETATDALVQEACKDILFNVKVSDVFQNQSFDIGTFGNNDLLLTKFDGNDEYSSAIVVEVGIAYRNNSQRRADGEFMVKLPDVSMEFSTVPILQ